MAIQQRASGVFARLQSLVDQVVTPDTRQDIYTNLNNFAHEQPYLFFFLAIQFVLSFTPFLLFLSFSGGVLALSLISALLFSLFWIGVALLLLLPTLFVTVSLGVGIWIWAASSWVIARWMYNILPISLRGTTEAGLPHGRKVVIDKGANGVGDVNAEIQERSYKEFKA